VLGAFERLNLDHPHYYGENREMLRDAIIAATENMSRLYELSGGVVHDGEKGAFREFFMAELIRPYIPEHFGVGSGVVVDAYGRQSRQSDIIIHDHRLMPPILLTGARGIFPIDSVLAVIEVKSTLEARHYQTLVEAGRRFSPNADHNPNGLRIGIPGTLDKSKATYPLFAVFAYTSDADKDEFERLQAQVPGGNEYIRLIGVLDKGVWSKSDGVYRNSNIGENAVKFLVQLLNKLENTAASRGKYRLQDWLWQPDRT